MGKVNWNELKKHKGTLDISIRYKNNSNEEFQQEYNIDISQYRYVLFESFIDSNEKVATEIEGLRRELQRKGSTKTRMSSLIKRLEKKKCPMRKELIPEDAMKCSKCGELLKEKTMPKKEA